MTPAEEHAADAALARLLDGYLITQLLHVAVRLDLASHLDGGPRTAADVADELGVDADRLRRVLRGLASEQVLTEDVEGRFGLTDLGRRLGSVAGAATARGDLYYPAAGHLFEALRPGRVPFELAYGAPLFDHLAASPDHAAVFQHSMVDRARREADAVADAFDFAGCRTVVDVGGGRGVVLAALLHRQPDLRGVLADQENALPAAQAYLQSAGVADRVTCAAIDFFDQVPPDGDVYLLCRVLHDWNDADAVRILETCRADMPDTARLVVVDAIVPELASDAPAAIRMDLNMMMLLGAGERTAAEVRTLLEAGGFKPERITPLDPFSGISMITGSPA
jgi:hypothetical protein